MSKADKNKRNNKDGDKDDDDHWLYFSKSQLTTAEILEGGFNNVILLNGKEWGEAEDEPLDETVADELGYAFGFDQEDEELQKLNADTRDAFKKAFIEVFKGWGGDHDFLIVVHGMKHFDADDPEWHMMTLIVNLIEESYAAGCKEAEDDMPGVSVCIEGGSKQLAGEWEDGKAFTYAAHSWQKEKLGWGDKKHYNYEEEEWDEEEEWGEEEWEAWEKNKSNKSSPKNSEKKDDGEVDEKSSKADKEGEEAAKEEK